MVLGIPIEPLWVELGGIALLLITGFQVAAGLRWIQLPRKYHLKTHKWLGIALFAFALFHGFLGLTYLNAWTVL